MSFLLALLLAAGPVKFDEFNFSIEAPPGWERVDTERKGHVHFRKGDANVQLLIVRGGPKTLEALAEWWRGSMEADFKEPEARVVNRKRKLGGVPCLEIAIVKNDQRLTWLVARHGPFAYALHMQRPAISDLDEEIGKIHESFRFLRKLKPTTPKDQPKPKPEPRKKLSVDYWLFDCVKPEGMSSMPEKEFDSTEKAASVVARFDIVKEQSRLMIRVFAHRKSLPIKMLGEQRIKEFAQRYPRHKEPVIDRKWQLPMARKALHLRFVGLKTTKVTEDWYFAECRNGCTYQFQIYRNGAAKWDAPVKDFLANFKPRKAGSKKRLAGPS